jgi:L-2-hydroxyglutarate oxidase
MRVSELALQFVRLAPGPTGTQAAFPAPDHFCSRTSREHCRVERTDFLVVGGGIIGLSLSLALRKRHSRASVTVLEKETDCGIHASGRNSGVLHAGFYYTADSLKARFTRDGNARMRAYCEERRLRINRCGKLVVARDEADLAGLDELMRRGRANGVDLEEISAEDAQRIEPRARTHERAIYSPTTCSVDPREVVTSMVRDARDAGISVRTGTAYRGARGSVVRTSSGDIAAGYVINAAGLYADRVARHFGFAERYRMLPFKGLYLYATADEQLRTNVYPVPDLRNPFLGVHFTVTAAGRVKIGPTATPAFWREHYSGFRNFDLRECTDIVSREAALFVRNDFGFRSLAIAELRKYSQPRMVRLASQLVSGINRESYRNWGPPGIRAQLIDVTTNKLEMDFRLEGDERSLHVLNAVSPGFTCAMPFADYVIDQAERLTA